MATKQPGHRNLSAVPTPSEIRAVLAVLSSTPKEIAKVARGCSERQLHRRPSVEAWSGREIVAHLRACAEVWGDGITRMLTEDHPTIRYVSPRTWIRSTGYLEQPFRDSLRIFSRRRSMLMKTLGRLAPGAWPRRATFTATTLGRNATVFGYATRIADHEVQHLEQLRRTVVK